MVAGTAGGEIIDRQMPSPAVMNQKMLLVDTGAVVAALVNKYVGQQAYITVTGGGLTALHLYVWSGSAWKDYGVGT